MTHKFINIVTESTTVAARAVLLCIDVELQRAGAGALSRETDKITLDIQHFQGGFRLGRFCPGGLCSGFL